RPPSGAPARLLLAACPLRAGGGPPTRQHLPPRPPPSEPPPRVRMAARPVRTEAVPLQKTPPNPRPPVGAPARVRITACPRRTGGGAPTKKTSPSLRPCRSTRPGCEWLPARFAPGRCSYKKPHAASAPVGAPAPDPKQARQTATPSTPPH